MGVADKLFGRSEGILLTILLYVPLEVSS